MKRQSVKLHTSGRKPDPRQLADAERRRKLMLYSAISGGSAALFMMTVAAIATVC